MAPGGALADPYHHDIGSALTVDVMLSEPVRRLHSHFTRPGRCSTKSGGDAGDKGADFGGAEFKTLEVDGELKPHRFEQGDALVRPAHMPRFPTAPA